MCFSTGVEVKVVNSYRFASEGRGEPVGDMTRAELAAALGDGWTVTDEAVVPVIASENTVMLGDVDGNGSIDANDASEVLAEYAATQTGAEPTLDAAAADVNSDSYVDSGDASEILAYYAFTMSGGVGSFPDYIAGNLTDPVK